MSDINFKNFVKELEKKRIEIFLGMPVTFTDCENIIIAGNKLSFYKGSREYIFNLDNISGYSIEHDPDEFIPYGGEL